VAYEQGQYDQDREFQIEGWKRMWGVYVDHEANQGGSVGCKHGPPLCQKKTREDEIAYGRAGMIGLDSIWGIRLNMDTKQLRMASRVDLRQCARDVRYGTISLGKKTQRSEDGKVTDGKTMMTVQFESDHTIHVPECV
jgi:hypothetical protein